MKKWPFWEKATFKNIILFSYFLDNEKLALKVKFWHLYKIYLILCPFLGKLTSHVTIEIKTYTYTYLGKIDCLKLFVKQIFHVTLEILNCPLQPSWFNSLKTKLWLLKSRISWSEVNRLLTVCLLLCWTLWWVRPRTLPFPVN